MHAVRIANGPGLCPGMPGPAAAYVADHFKSGVRNAQYISPQIQNDLILCTGEWIRKQIIQEVQQAKFFSVSADEAADICNKEQLPLVLRFVDANNTIREEFVDFVYGHIRN